MLERIPFFVRRPRASSAHCARDESRAHRGCKHPAHRARDDESGVAGESRRMKSARSSVKKLVTDSNPYTVYSEKEDFTGTMGESKQVCQGTWFQDKRLADKEDVLYVARRMKAFWETYPDGFTQEYCRHAGGTHYCTSRRPVRQHHLALYAAGHLHAIIYITHRTV